MCRAILVGFIFVAALFSCVHQPINPCPNCPPNISFKADVIPIFASSCAITGCHNAITDTFSLNFDSTHAYLSATEPGTGYVTPGDTGNSYLYQVLLSGSMPPKGSGPLTPCQVEEIGCWIEEGALNN